jgi:dihydrofolate reductase
MSKIVVAEFVSLDGFISDSEGRKDWQSASPDEATDREMIEAQSRWGTLLFGRVTYQEIRAWADVPVENNPIARFMNEVPKVVFSKSLESAPWGKWKPVRIVSSSIEDEIQRLRKQPGKDVAILGSASLVQHLTSKKLVDEYLFWVYPVTIGSGKPWAPKGKLARFKLVSARGFKSGITQLVYQPAES